MQPVIDFIVGRWNTLDPKLKYTVLTFALARIATALALHWDPVTESIISGVLAAVAGYKAPNEGTVLRTPQEDGNAEIPPEVEEA